MPPTEVVCLTSGPFAENCYILAEPESRKAVLIDPGEDARLFLNRLSRERYRLEAIWLTHAHVDHIQGVAAVKAVHDVPILLHPADRSLYDAAKEQAEWLGVSMDPPPPPDTPLKDGETLPVGDLRFEVRHVPGHSPGSVAFVGHGVAISGDAVFAGSIGRTDLPGGSLATLLSSIRDQLLSLPDGTVVYSGHGPETTIGEERRSNPFLTGLAQLSGASCLRCGHAIRSRAWGCKNPCPHCGFVYPQGDCSD